MSIRDRLAGLVARLKAMPVKELRDQSAHAVAGFIISLLVAANPVAGAIAALSAGLAREFTEWQAKPDHGRFPWAGPGSIISPGSLRDLAVWALSGALGGLA
jgi:hypothetical protein